MIVIILSLAAGMVMAIQFMAIQFINYKPGYSRASQPKHKTDAEMVLLMTGGTLC